MKKILLALGFTMATSTSFAAGITSGMMEVTDGAQPFGTAAIIPTSGDDGWGGNEGAPFATGQVGTNAVAGMYTQGSTGQLNLTQAAQVTFTYLGSVAGNSNNFDWYVNGTRMDNTAPGSSVSFAADAGRLRFGFYDATMNVTVKNGDLNSAVAGILFLDAAVWNKKFGTSFDFLVGFNDGADVNADFDDYVVGVSAVPVPAALPLMASGLGLLGFGARRKQKATA